MPNPNHYPIVMHLDNNKANPIVSNLQWGTASQNGKAASRDKLFVNKKGYEDSQSIAVCCFNMNYEFLADYGSIGQASRHTGITKIAILNQCNHNVKTKPRCGYYFRYLSEYNEKGFVL